ncbi:hypothetical protein [uncultured Algibacter sp.]|uniref:hypothetical protein n=1 Tax=uncultured Algibacter sp. TaxID=298659 RepID=UPI0026145889|nr:hypothetical protein [uncultured Algibacter sp.]
MFTNFYSTLGQNVVEPLIPDIVKKFLNVRDIAISPDGNDIMFSAQSVMGNISTIIYVKKNENTFSDPEIASFSGQFFDLEPFFSHDGLKLYFASTRPIDNSTLEPKDFDIWYVERETTNSIWSEPKNMGSPINSEHGEFYPSIATNGNFYFTRDNPELKRKDDIYVSEFKIGKYTEPKLLPDAINSDGYEYNAFIAPDESYLIFGCYNRKDGLGSGDLYISFNENGNWSQAKNLGNTINSKQMDYCPFVDQKTNTLYFTSKRDNTNTEFKKPLSINELDNVFNQYDNGLSRLYNVDIEFLLKTKALKN